MIPVKVNQLLLSNMGFVVLLKGSDDKRTLPIFIGASEAQSIAIVINNVKVPRPLTHDLMKNILDFMECRLQRIEVCDLADGTFFARLVLEKDGEEMQMDSRPSDAIALALRFGSPIFVAEKVMNEAGQVLNGSDIASGGGKDMAQKIDDEKEEEAQDISPLDMLKRDLEKAIKEERYEDAAKLRDELKRLDNNDN